MIVFVIAVTSVINTLSMSVLERTREIGTLRALGLKRRGIVKLFALEGALLGVLGSIFGVILMSLVWIGMTLAKPQWIPPSSVREIPLEIYLVPVYIILSIIFLVTLAAVVAMLPARKAAHKGIVDALGHV